MPYPDTIVAEMDDINRRRFRLGRRRRRSFFESRSRRKIKQSMIFSYPTNQIRSNAFHQRSRHDFKILQNFFSQSLSMSFSPLKTKSFKLSLEIFFLGDDGRREGGERKIGLVKTTLLLASTSSISLLLPLFLNICQIGPINPFQINIVLKLQMNNG